MYCIYKSPNKFIRKIFLKLRKCQAPCLYKIWSMEYEAETTFDSYLSMLTDKKSWLKLLQSHSAKTFFIAVFSQQGQLHGWARAQCDTAFKSDMDRECEQSIRGTRFLTSLWNWLKGVVSDKVKRCKAGADIYFNSVYYFDHANFEELSPSWCAQRALVIPAMSCLAKTVAKKQNRTMPARKNKSVVLCWS